MNTDKTYAEQLASEYAPKETSKVVALRKLDRQAKLPANIIAFSLGVISALLLDVGMCLSMNVIGDGSPGLFIVGVIVGILGIAGICLNYSLYKRNLAKGKQRYGSDIIKLAEEIASHSR